MKKLIISLLLFLFIITSSKKSSLVGLWQAPDGSTLSVSQTKISLDGSSYPYRYLTDTTVVIFKNGRAHKTAYMLSFDKNTLTIFGKSYDRARPWI